MAPAPPLPDPQLKPKAPACPLFTPAERAAMHPEWPDGAEVQGVYGATLRGRPKQFVWFRGKIQGRLAIPGQHGNLQLKIKWQALPEWRKKVETSNLKLWDNRPFPEGPVQLCTPANQVTPCTIWTGDVPQTWLGEPDIPEEQRVATAINHKLRLGQSLLPRPARDPPEATKARAHEVTTALVTLMSLNEPGALYDAAEALDLQDLPIMANCDPNAMVWQEQALKAEAVCPNVTPVLTRTGHRYHTTWVKGVPISHKGEVQVHVHHHLGVEGHLAAYELVGPTWQLNVINVHVHFGDTTETFLEHLMETYRQLAMMGPTVIIGDFNAAPSADDRGGRQTPEGAAVQVAMQHLGLQDLTASLRGQPSHRPPQLCAADSRIDLCCADSAHVDVTRAQYHDLPSKITGHRPLEIQIKVLQVPPASKHGMDHEEQPPIKQPGEHNTHKWVAYYRTVQRILDQQDKADLNLAMQQAATAYGLNGQHRTQDDTTPHQDLRSLVTTIWHDKRALHTAVHSHDLQAEHDTKEIAARLDTTQRQLREWHIRRAKKLAQEQQRYFQNPQPYKSLNTWTKSWGRQATQASRRYAYRTAQ